MTTPSLEDQLSCAFADIGGQIGELIRCLIDQEIASHMGRINQLNAVLSGTVCEPSQSRLPSEESPAS
jgi:hypothetical protein